MKFQPGDPKPANGGRKKGTPNKTTVLLKEAILEAAEQAGDGDLVAYLTRMADEQPSSFLALLGRVLPLQLQSDGDNTSTIRRVEYVIIDPRETPMLTLDSQGETKQ